MKEIKLGIIGIGNIGLSHANCIARGETVSDQIEWKGYEQKTRYKRRISEHAYPVFFNLAGSAGFEKTLKATFRVLDKNAKVYKSVKNTDEYVLLTVWSEALSGDLAVDFSGLSVIPDNTEAVMAGTKTSDGALEDTVNFKEKFSSHSYRFFKASPVTISADDFAVTLNGVKAEAKTPEK